MARLLNSFRVVLVAILPALLRAGAADAGPDDGATGADPGADAVAATVEPFFRPFEAEVAALAPNGRWLAIGQADRSGTSILLVDLEAETSRKLQVTPPSQGRHHVTGLLWQSADTLVFTLRNSAVGTIAAETGKLSPLLRPDDVREFVPEPSLGNRRSTVVRSPDMPADAGMVTPNQLGQQQVSLDSPVVQALISGDLFDAGARRTSARSLRSGLIGMREGAPGAVLVEMRADRDPLDDARRHNPRIVVPSGVIVTDSPSALNSQMEAPNSLPGSYASYDVIFPPVPHVVLEFAPGSWRRRVVLENQNWLHVVTDRQGRPRLALEATGQRRRILYREAEGKKWIPLDDIVKEPVPLGFSVTPETLLAPRAVPLGFDYDGNRLYIASNLDADTFGLRALDTTTGRLTDLEVTHQLADLAEPTDLLREDALVMDPHRRELAGVHYDAGMRETLWLDPELAALQVALDERLAPHRCRILGWDAARNRFLLDVSGPGDPGGFHFFDLARGRLVSCAARAPWLTTDRVSPVHEFEFTTDDGRRLKGSITVPSRPRLSPAPVLVYFHDGPWFCNPPVFDRGAQALAALGFAVLQVNHRGSAGAGRAHLMAIRDGFDRVVLDDVRAVLERAAVHLPVNPRLVAALGNGFGGYLAVRAVQLEPERYRCAVAINTPADLAAWCAASHSSGFLGGVRRQFFGDDLVALREISAVRAAPAVTRPVLVVHGTENAYVPEWMGRQLHHALRKSSAAPDYMALNGEGHSGWSRRSTQALFAELGRFFNATVYTYTVELGPMTVEP